MRNTLGFGASSDIFCAITGTSGRFGPNACSDSRTRAGGDSRTDACRHSRTCAGGVIG